MADARPAWPQAEPGSAHELEVFKAQLAEVAAARAASDPRCDAIDDRFADAFYGVLKARFDRSGTTVETLQRSAAALAGLYGAAIGVAFSVTDRPLPLRGLLPLLFLGIAVVTSTVHLAWQGGGGGRRVGDARPEEQTDGFQRQRAYIIDFAAVVGDFVNRRLSWLRAAIVAIAFGLVLIPVPFVDIETGDAADASAPPVELPAWPEPPASVSAETHDFDVALYEAQVVEAAEARTAARAEAEEAAPATGLRVSWMPEYGWAVLAAVLLALVLAVALRPVR